MKIRKILLLLFKTGKLKLICDVIYSRIRNEIYTKQRISRRNAAKFIQFLHECAPTVHYHTGVRKVRINSA